MADVDMAKGVIETLRGAWPAELERYSDADIWVAYVDILVDAESYETVLKLEHLLGYLGGIS